MNPKVAESVYTQAVTSGMVLRCSAHYRPDGRHLDRTGRWEREKARGTGLHPISKCH